MIMSSVLNVGWRAASIPVEATQRVSTNVAGPNFSKLLDTQVDNLPSNRDELVEDKLSGMFLGNMVQLMLPKENGMFFAGRETAGIWSSFFANAVADRLNVSGKIDLRLGRT